MKMLATCRPKRPHLGKQALHHSSQSMYVLGPRSSRMGTPSGSRETPSRPKHVLYAMYVPTLNPKPLTLNPQPYAL